MKLTKSDWQILLVLSGICVFVFVLVPIIEYYSNYMERYTLEDVTDFALHGNSEKLFEIIQKSTNTKLVDASYDAICSNNLENGIAKLKLEFNNNPQKRIEILDAMTRHHSAISTKSWLIDFYFDPTQIAIDDTSLIYGFERMLTSMNPAVVDSVFCYRMKLNMNQLDALFFLAKLWKQSGPLSDSSQGTAILNKIVSEIITIDMETKSHQERIDQIKNYEAELQQFKESGYKIMGFAIRKRFSTNNKGEGLYDAVSYDQYQRVVLIASPDHIPSNPISRMNVRLVVQSEGEIPFEAENGYGNTSTLYLQAYSFVDGYENIPTDMRKLPELKRKDASEYPAIKKKVDQQMEGIKHDIELL